METFDDAADRKQKPIIKVILYILSNILIGVLGLFIIYMLVTMFTGRK